MKQQDQLASLRECINQFPVKLPAKIDEKLSSLSPVSLSYVTSLTHHLRDIFSPYLSHPSLSKSLRDQASELIGDLLQLMINEAAQEKNLATMANRLIKLTRMFDQRHTLPFSIIAYWITALAEIKQSGQLNHFMISVLTLRVLWQTKRSSEEIAQDAEFQSEFKVVFKQNINYLLSILKNYSLDESAVKEEYSINLSHCSASTSSDSLSSEARKNMDKPRDAAAVANRPKIDRINKLLVLDQLIAIEPLKSSFKLNMVQRLQNKISLIDIIAQAWQVLTQSFSLTEASKSLKRHDYKNAYESLMQAVVDAGEYAPLFVQLIINFAEYLSLQYPDESTMLIPLLGKIVQREKLWQWDFAKSEQTAKEQNLPNKNSTVEDRSVEDPFAKLWRKYDNEEVMGALLAECHKQTPQVEQHPRGRQPTERIMLSRCGLNVFRRVIVAGEMVQSSSILSSRGKAAGPRL